MIAILVWQLNSTNIKSQTKSDDYIIEKKVNNTTTANGALAKPAENIVLNVKSKSGKTVPTDRIEWWYDTSTINFNNINLEPASENTLQLKVVSESVIVNHSTINITAIITEDNGNKVTTSIDIPIGSFIPTPAPKEFFEFGSKDDNGIKDMLLGFDEDVGFDELKEYNTLDFDSFGNEVEYVSGDFSFPEELFDDWEVAEINFGSLTYLPNEEGESGNGIFENCDLHTVTRIDYSDSVWASEGTNSSASHTFDNANLSSLREIDMSDATFAVEGMSSGKDGNTPIRTADSTFANTDLPSLTTLNLDGAIFASDGMSNEADVHTAYRTFYNTSLLDLTLLDLSNSIFAVPEMTNSGYVYTGSQTFDSSVMSNVNEAYLEKEDNKAIFGAAKMTVAGDSYTGYKTFEYADLSNIPEKDAENTIVGQGVFEIPDEVMSEEGNEYIGGDKKSDVDTYWNTLFQIVFVPVPITTEFFSFAEEANEDGVLVSAITGFSPEVEQAYESKTGTPLAPYNALDFTWQDSNGTAHTKYIGGTCSFNKKDHGAVINSWEELQKIDFGDMVILNEYLPDANRPEWRTGEHLFNYNLSGINLSHVLTINFNHSVWATKNTCLSATFVFYEADLSNLMQLDMSNAIFAAPNMSTIATAEWQQISTADGTFYGAYMPQLKKLNLKGAVFAVGEMTNRKTTIYTAMQTFYYAKMENLETLDLSTTIFSASYMSTAPDLKGSGIQTGCETFGEVNFSSLTKLVLSKGKKHAIFASNHMTHENGANTADETFRQATMSCISENEVVGKGIYEVDDIGTQEVNFGTDIFQSVRWKSEIKALPIDGRFFEFETRNTANGNIKVITGTKQMDNSWLNYNSLDFSICDEQLYVSESFNFKPADDNNFIYTRNFVKIDFGNLIFLSDEEGKSGNGIFKDWDLRNVTSINFNHSVWATPGTKYSANETFANANLMHLSDLNFGWAVFACEDMDSGIDNSVENGVHSAYKTFYDAKFYDKLLHLNLKGAVLACEGMAKGNTNVYTAAHTFDLAYLPQLMTLSLFDAVFAIKGMSVSGSVYTAYCTFQNATMNKLETRNMFFREIKRYAKFGAKQISVSGNVYTGCHTFDHAKLEMVTSQDIEDLESELESLFSINDMTGGISTPMDHTFNEVILKTTT